ncbi:MAG: hypothetical protein KME35_00055 [Aphanocapsa sp. GSE-SYN-MK-11-07L]|jgi:hypothetical protein|nr:hypothetical protein [Aphanocapsa sp. GSE-SYN-MK-11-07L]
MTTSKLVINSILASFCIVAFSASVSLAKPAKPVSATGGAHGAGVLVLKTHNNQQTSN